MLLRSFLARKINRLLCQNPDLLVFRSALGDRFEQIGATLHSREFLHENFCMF